MPRPFNRLEGSLRSYRDRVASGHIASDCPQLQSTSGNFSVFTPMKQVRDGIQGDHGGWFGGHGNLRRGAGSSRSGVVARTCQGGVGAGQGRMFAMAEQEAHEFSNVATGMKRIGDKVYWCWF
ncbi:hypothetical protein LIER_42320 [Lithospermum erythrorhizon]|uniref:Uncharacterized protein n=1 Tax=Lithospermum erythrorhizon TaxID=34254 RepID=A0AAV3RMN0_LITER